jgi:hypothetical protein
MITVLRAARLLTSDLIPLYSTVMRLPETCCHYWIIKPLADLLIKMYAIILGERMANIIAIAFYAWIQSNDFRVSKKIFDIIFIPLVRANSRKIEALVSRLVEYRDRLLDT